MHTFSLHKSFIITVLVAVIGILFVSSSALGALSKKDIVYPMKELNNCKNETDCFTFCDEADNIEVAKACLLVAKKYNLLPQKEIEEGERYILRLGITRGPGGCRDEEECNAYCEDTDNLKECVDFAEHHNLRSSDEIAEGRKLLLVLNAGAELPGGCKTKDECEAYCEDSSHMKECVLFAEKAGFITPEEAKEAKKIIPILESGGRTPGNCNRKASCEAYCEDSAHLDECLAFAERANLLDPEELADARRFSPYIKNGTTPGGCKRKAECETYCEDTAHFDECVDFAIKVGMITEKEAELARKIKGTGPGGCSSREACEEFCEASENQEVCINFAKEHGLVDEIKEIEKKVRGEVEEKMRVCATKLCGEMIECLQSLRQQGEITKSERGVEKDETADLPEDIRAKLNMCVEEIKSEAVKRETEGRQKDGDHSNRDGSSQVPPSSTAPAGSSKEYQQQYEVEYKKQYDAEVKRQTDEATKAQVEAQTKSQVDCSLFEAAPTCDYFGAGTPNHGYCKQCFPNK